MTQSPKPTHRLRSILGDIAGVVERIGTRRHGGARQRHRLGRVPSFVRGMVKRIYTDYAVQHGIVEITPGVMDRAREELGLEGM